MSSQIPKFNLPTYLFDKPDYLSLKTDVEKGKYDRLNFILEGLKILGSLNYREGSFVNTNRKHCCRLLKLMATGNIQKKINQNTVYKITEIFVQAGVLNKGKETIIFKVKDGKKEYFNKAILLLRNNFFRGILKGEKTTLSFEHVEKETAYQYGNIIHFNNCNFIKTTKLAQNLLLFTTDVRDEKAKEAVMQHILENLLKKNCHEEDWKLWLDFIKTQPQILSKKEVHDIETGFVKSYFLKNKIKFKTYDKQLALYYSHCTVLQSKGILGKLIRQKIETFAFDIYGENENYENLLFARTMKEKENPFKGIKTYLFCFNFTPINQLNKNSDERSSNRNDPSYHALYTNKWLQNSETELVFHLGDSYSIGLFLDILSKHGNNLNFKKVRIPNTPNFKIIAHYHNITTNDLKLLESQKN